MRVRLKNISLFARSVQWHEGWGIQKIVEKERDRERGERKRERRVLFCTYFELG